MKLSDLKPGDKLYTQLGCYVLAVLSRRVDGWCVYVDAVPGEEHSVEWQEVARSGEKQNEKVAEAIVQNLFHPGFEIDLPGEKWAIAVG